MSLIIIYGVSPDPERSAAEKSWPLIFLDEDQANAYVAQHPGHVVVPLMEDADVAIAAVAGAEPIPDTIEGAFWPPCEVCGSDGYPADFVLEARPFSVRVFIDLSTGLRSTGDEMPSGVMTKRYQCFRCAVVEHLEAGRVRHAGQLVDDWPIILALRSEPTSLSYRQA